MANDSYIDSWKPRSDFNESAQRSSPNLRRKSALTDHRSHFGATCEDAAYYHAQARVSRSGPEIRYINPAIYTESIEEEERDAVQLRSASGHQLKDHGCYNEQAIDAQFSTLDLSVIPTKNVKSVDTADEHPVTGQNTYRCYSTTDTTSLESSTACSAVSSGTTIQVERRCRIDDTLENVCQNKAIKRDKYTLDNRQVVRISTTASLSSCSNAVDCQVSNGSDFARKIAHAEWVRKKHEAAQRKREEEERAMKKRQEEEEEIERQKEAKARLEKENFLKWVERKRRQELDRKAMLETELELQKRLKEIEDKAAVAKALYLRQWIHKKKEEQKIRHKEQEMKQKKLNEEREKRLEESSKAYEKWRENSKNRPKPATQGLLPHQKAKPAYVNPIPWQPIVKIDSDEEQENAFNGKKGNTSQLKMSARKMMVH